MSATPSIDRKRRLIVWIIVVTTLIFGLHPHEYRFRNNVVVSEHPVALEFVPQGVAYTGRFLSPKEGRQLDERGFTLVFRLARSEQRQEGFAMLANMHAGDDATQLVVGRWSDHLIVMNGDDYRSRFKHPRISARIPQGTNGVESIAVASSRAGSRIYFNGRLVKESKDVELKIPTAPRPARVALGNSVRGTHGWRGALREFTLFDKVLSDEEVMRDHQFTPGDPPGRVSEVAHDRIWVRYNAQFTDSHYVHNSSFSGHLLAGYRLTFPKRRVVADPRFLSFPFGHQFEFNRSFVSDVVVNFFGFIPCGLVLAWAGVRVGRLNRFVSAVVLAALTSLLIEILQAWLPSRDSSALDLTLNTLGGAFGAFLAARYFVARVTSTCPDSSPADSSE